MAYHVEFTQEAAQELRALPKHIQKRVIRWADLLAEDPRRTPSRQLEGCAGLRRIHASKDYVLVYTVDDKKVLVLIVRVGHRGQGVYKRLPPGKS